MSIIQEALKKAQDPDSKPKAAPNVFIAEKTVSWPNSPAGAKDGVPSKKPFNFSFIIFAVLISVAVVLIFKDFFFRSASNTKNIPVAANAVSHQEILYKPIAQEKQPEPKVEEPAIVEAKPISYLAAKPDIPELFLNGIMYLPNRPQAIINSSVVEQGDVISGAKVVIINKNSVVLNFNDQEITLVLHK